MRGNNSGFVQLQILPVSTGGNSDWLRYFMAALSLGGMVQADEVRMNYWWVYSDQKPADQTRVIRVIGAKGESYEEVYGNNKSQDSALVERRQMLQAGLRTSALAIANRLIEEGRPPRQAYEEAWSLVYRRHWLNADFRAGSSLLDDILERMLSYDGQHPFTEEEIRVAMEALLEDDDRLETEEGRLLLEQLASRLRAMGLGRELYVDNNDELMSRFADAMRHGKEGASAYRDALFKTHRGSVVNHPLMGYAAPWGAGMGGGTRYHQAPLKVTRTAGSGNSSSIVAPGSGTPVENPFLATSSSSSRRGRRGGKEEGRKENAQDDTSTGPAPVYMGPLNAGAGSRGMRMMAASPLSTTAVAEIAADLTVAEGKNASLHVDGTPNSYNGATWSRSGNYYNWSGTQLNSPGSIDTVKLNNGSHLYLGAPGNRDISVIVAGTGTYLHAEDQAGNNSRNRRGTAGRGLFTYTNLLGNGSITLMADYASANSRNNSTTIYAFDGTPAEGQEFGGTIMFAASQSYNRVQLNIKGEHWSDALIDLTRRTGTGYNANDGAVAVSAILNVVGNTTIKGLSGGDANTTVTSNSGDASYTLTLGCSGDDYQYAGTLNGAYYTGYSSSSTSTAPLNLTKTGSNTQTFTADLSSDTINVLTVNGGAFNFDSDADASTGFDREIASRYVYVNEGGSLNAGSLAVTGIKVGEPEFFVQGGSVQVDGAVDVTYDAGVSAGASVTAGSMSVGNILAVDGAGTTLVVNGNASAVNVQVTNAGSFTTKGNLTVTSDLEIGSAHTYSAEAARSLVSIGGGLTMGGLRLRADGALETAGNAAITGDSYLYGGAEWHMEGAKNQLQGDLLKLVDVGTQAVTLSSDSSAPGDSVLTLPGVISFADAGWTNKNQAVFNLDGVTLDFLTGVTLANLDFTVNEHDVITLATSASGEGWYTAASPNVTLQSGNAFYHGVLSQSGNDIIITVQHQIDFSKEPFTLGASDVVYIEMYEDAAHPALPYLAYDDAVYNSGSWSDVNEEVPVVELMRFNNVVFTEGGHLYMGENLSVEDGVDYRKDRQFGGNIKIVDNGSKTAYLHGEINNWGNWLLGGHLSGEGDLKLVSHNGAASVEPGTSILPTTSETVNDITTTVESTLQTTVHGVSSTFTFTDTQSSSAGIFSGILSVDDFNGSIVQLNVGNVSFGGKGDLRWQRALIDLSHQDMTDPATGKTTQDSKATLVLGVQGDATVRGIQGDAGSYVVSGRQSTSNLPSVVLTVGEQSDADYDFAGTIGSGKFYTGGDAYTKVTTTTTTVTDKLTGISNTTTTTSTAEYNFYTTRDNSLSLTKVGSNTQTFSGTAYLDKVVAQEGRLVFSGTADINEMTVHKDARVDAHILTLDAVNLHGGAEWYADVQNPDSYDTEVRIVDVFGANGTATPVTLGSTYASWGSSGSTWKTAMNVDMAHAGTWTETSGAIFKLVNVKLDLDSPRVIVNMAGITAGSKIAMYSGVSGNYSFLDNMVMVQDANGVFYDADYVLENGVIYLQLADTAVNYGIVVNQQPHHTDKIGYIWSGENNGYTVNDVHYINMTMGNVWRADGSAYNTGWHEQRAVGSANTDIGIYENGNAVYFLDTNVHGDKENHRLVDISGKVAPGMMYVHADQNLGHAGSDGAEGQMWYGYAFTSTDGTGSITDNGTTPTSIIKSGDALLVLNIANSFTGGIEVQDGGLYLAAPGAAGTGTLTFHTDQEWSLPIVGADTWGNAVQLERLGAELQICYPHSDEDASAFRSSSLANDIVMTGGRDSAGQLTISFAYSSFNNGGSDHQNVPRHWRNLYLSGALVGAGYEADGKWVNTSADDKLVLMGYCSTWSNVRDQSYVTMLTLNEDHVGKNAYRVENKEIVNRFAGTVVLKNAVNTSPLPTNTLDNRIAGTVQVMLKGEKLSEAELDMTRESVKHSGESSPRQTYNNILVLNGDASLRGLTAEFVGSGYYFPENNGNSGSATRTFKTSLEQMDEVWHVRTLTAGLTKLQLGESGDTRTYVYSGAMGFAQAYVSDAEAHIPWGDGFFEHTGEWYFDGHSMANTNLSVTKSGDSSQYIHTACLQDVSVYDGTLGFNNLQLLGNMNLVGGSTLQLGVTGTVGDQQWDASSSSSWNLISAYKHVYTSSSVTVEAGKTLTVITPKPTGDNVLPSAAVVEGDLTLSEAVGNKAAAALTFVVDGVIPAADDSKETGDDTNYRYPLLDVKGTFTLEDNTGITISFSGVDFSSESFSDKTYFLAAADNIVIGNGGDSSSFTSRVISLGYGYFGVLDTLDSSKTGLPSPTNRDYLVMTVNGDPRRTWSGMVDLNGNNYTWNSTSTGDAGHFDYRWKENLPFKNGQVVLFGNLYQPELWEKEKSDLKSSDTVQVIETLHPGTTIALDESYTSGEQKIYFDIDGYRNSVAGYQKVLVEGAVAPSAIIINSDYQLKKNGTSVFVDTPDATNYYFYGSGQIVNASKTEKEAAGFDDRWETMLNKTGKGTAVIALDNRYTGGSVLQGGRVVMQHVNALGHVYTPGADDGTLTGNDCTITLMNGAMLQGDFDDADFPGNHDDGAATSEGGFMKTTTIRNKVVVNVYADPNNPEYESLVDGVLINSYDKKLVLQTLEGETDTVLELAGVGLSADKSATLDMDGDGEADGNRNLFRYGVFKVLDPGKFYGTVSMSGHVWGAAADNAAALGAVQLDIMSTAKSSEDADWTNATVDLTVHEGTARTVVALDVMSEGEICELNSINGSIIQSGGSSSVLNMSRHNTAVLKLTGTRNGQYEGVLGYGDFQVAVDYGGYSDEEHYTTQHHYGAEGYGALDVIKEGDGTTQAVRRAWLHALTVTGGIFKVDEALVAHDITSGGGNRVMVGEVDTATLYSLSVGKGGILAMNTTFAESGVKEDAWENIQSGSTAGDTTTKAAWVQLLDGATLSAREDWYTRKQVDIATDASITINTHNFAIDPYITATNDVFGKYERSHIIQLLGKFSGRNVTLTLNNQLTNPAAQDADVGTSDDSKYMGYVALNDLNDLSGSSKVKVEGMTVLQILGDNGGVEADVDIHVEGKHATLQILDKVTSYGEDNKAALSDTMVQYIDKLTLGANKLDPGADNSPTSGSNDPLYRENNGQLMLGGAEVTALMPEGEDALRSPKRADLQVLLSSRHNSTTLKGEVTHLHVDMRGNAVKLGGAAGHRAGMTNTHIDMARSDISHVLYHADLKNSLVHLQEDCSVNISEAVLLDYKSEIQGVKVDYDSLAVNPAIGGINSDGTVSAGPVVAAGNNPTKMTKEVYTSQQTTVQMTFAGQSHQTYTVGSRNSEIVVVQTEQFKGVDVTGNGLTIQLYDDTWYTWVTPNTKYLAIQMGGGSGHFLYEVDNTTYSFGELIGSQFVLQDRNGNPLPTTRWVTSTEVSQETGAEVTKYMLYFAVNVPEPATATLSLLALTALCARRRRRA